MAVNTQTILVALATILFPQKDGYDDVKLREALADFYRAHRPPETDAKAIAHTATARYQSWMVRACVSPRTKLGERNEFLVFAQWIAARGDQGHDVLKRVAAASTSADLVAIFTGSTGGGQTDDATIIQSLAGKSHDMTSLHGTWVVARPSTLGCPVVEVMMLWGDQKSGRTQGLWINDFKNPFVGDLLRSQAVLYGLFGREVKETNSFNMRSLMLTLGTEGRHNAMLGYSTGRRDNEGGVLASVLVLAFRLDHVQVSDLAAAHRHLEGYTDDVGLRHPDDHPVFKMFGQVVDRSGGDENADVPAYVAQPLLGYKQFLDLLGRKGIVNPVTGCLLTPLVKKRESGAA